MDKLECKKCGRKEVFVEKFTEYTKVSKYINGKGEEISRETGTPEINDILGLFCWECGEQLDDV